MKKKCLFRIGRLSDLETLEEKSFWLVAIVLIALGVASLLTAGSYGSLIPAAIAVVLCLVIPGTLIVIVVRNKNYRSAYPLLCIAMGGISIPIMFVVGGGFFSGMPMFCVILTGLTALCSSPRWRFISLGFCVLGTTLAYTYVYLAGPAYLEPILPDLRFPIVGTDDLYSNMSAAYAVYNDMFFTYYCASAGLFSIINFTTSDIRRYKLKQDTLQQFFDKEKRKEILNKALQSNLSESSDHKNAAILFADISNFTSITEKMPSDLIMAYLNEFFTIFSSQIHKTNGIIDKYIGDCVMAYWVDQEGENCVLNAIETVTRTKQEMIEKMETIYAKFGTELNFSAGIAYGDVIFGDIGSDTMHDYTIIGDAVNTASRIEGLAASGETLMSGQALQKIKDLVEFESVENDYFIKGKNKPVDLYRVNGLLSERREQTVPVGVENGYTLCICGCRGSFPVSGLRFSEYGGETSCYVIRKDDYAVIVDCGTGLKNAVKIVEGCKKIDILLTHLHYDHILGLLMSKFPADCKIRIFGRFGAWDESGAAFRSFMHRPYWPVEVVNMEKIDVELGREIPLEKDMTAAFYPADHPDDACVIRVMCAGKKVVFLADCENADLVDPAVAEGSEILFFDGMFDDEYIEAHKGWGHGTWQGGVRFAREKHVKKLVVTHHNPEFGDHSLKEKESLAREMSPNVSFAKSGDIFTL